MTGDPILAATTVAELMAAANQVYGWDYPVTAPPGLLAQMWAVGITVVKDPAAGVLYRATATTDLPFATGLSGGVLVQITTTEETA